MLNRQHYRIDFGGIVVIPVLLIITMACELDTFFVRSYAASPDELSGAVASPDDAVTNLLYEDPEYGVKMYYPNDWEIDIRNEGSIAVFFSPEADNQGEVGNTTLEHLALYADRGPGITDLSTYSERVISNYSNEIQGFRVLERSDASLAGGDAHQIDFVAQDDQGEFRVLDIWTIRNNVAYHAVFYSDLEDYERYLGTVRGMLHSLEILPVMLDRPIIGGFYELASVGLEISLPEDWRGYETHEDGSTFSFLSPPDIPSGSDETADGSFIFMFILVQDSRFTLQNNWNAYDCEHITQASIATIGNYRGVQAITSCEHPRIEILNIYEFASNNKDFVIAYGGTEDAYGSQLETFESSVRSIKLTSPSDPSDVREYARLSGLELSTQSINVGEDNYDFDIATGSKIEEVYLDEDYNELVIKMDEGTAGWEVYLRPSWFVRDPFVVIVDDEEISDGVLMIKDGDGYYLNVIDNRNNIQEIRIRGSSTVPEFPPGLFLLAFSSLWFLLYALGPHSHVNKYSHGSTLS